ncbi:MAG: PEP-CTERM sorting domain-containing protein [Chloroflexi bacterium]|nr:MAG: PEP-CTERM sorting domain-containing protein [Chloroflexota bacterium]
MMLSRSEDWKIPEPGTLIGAGVGLAAWIAAATRLETITETPPAIRTR